MIVTNGTEQRIIELMKRGAKLVQHVSYHPDFGANVVLTELRHNGKSLRLTTKLRSDEGYYDNRGEIFRPRCYGWRNTASVCYGWLNWLADDKLIGKIIMRCDIREGYAGYRSDYASNWLQMFEHITQPVPRWISEQWETPTSRY